MALMGSPITLRESTSERRNMSSAHIRPEPAVRPGAYGQQDLALFRCEAPVGALTVLRELKILGWVVGDQSGLPGTAEQLPHDAAEFLHMRPGHPGLSIQDPLEVDVLHGLEFHVANRRFDISVIFFIIHSETFGCEPLRVLVCGLPLFVPGVYRHAPVEGFLAAFGGGDLVGQPGQGLQLGTAGCLVLFSIPACGFPIGLSGFVFRHNGTSKTNVPVLGF